MSIKEKYSNGKIPSKGLEKIDTGQYLEENARNSYMRMKKDAQKEGITIDLSGKSSGYRKCGQKGDYTEGLSGGLFTQWYAWELYRAGKGNLASNPTTSKGCKSNHGWGLAIDVKNKKGARDWIKKNGEKYGWWWSGGTFSRIEDWHFDYDIKRDTFLKENKKNKGQWILYTFIGIAVVGMAVGFYFATRPKK